MQWYEWSEMTSPEIRDALRTLKLAIIPVGANTGISAISSVCCALFQGRSADGVSCRPLPEFDGLVR